MFKGGFQNGFVFNNPAGTLTLFSSLATAKSIIISKRKAFNYLQIYVQNNNIFERRTGSISPVAIIMKTNLSTMKKKWGLV